MSCFHPRHIKVEKVFHAGYAFDYSKNRYVSLGGGSSYYILVPCGKCRACLAEFQSQWAFRLEQEALYGGHASTLFVTLTYAQDSLPSDLSVHKEEVQRYIHDLRQMIGYRYKDKKVKLKYFFCAEYGSKRGRPHYHALLFLSDSVDWSLIQRAWNKGIVDIRPFSSARAGYVAKYSVKQNNLDYEGRLPTFHLQSNGLGECFLAGKSLDTLNGSLYWRNLSGRRVKLPRYYLEKLGYERKRFRWKTADGLVITKSFSHKTPAMHYLSLRIRSEFYKQDAVRRSLFGNTARSYDVWLADNTVRMEQVLENRFWKESAYARLTSLGL